MSKIAILGASGNVGTVLVAEALLRGHTVTALARNVSKLPSHPNLHGELVDLHDAATLQAKVAGHDAVISAVHFVGVRPGELLAPINQAGVKRLLIVGGAASLNVAPGMRLLDSPQFPAEYKAEASAASDFLDTLRHERTVDWTFISPSMEFISGERTGQFRLGGDDLLIDVEGRSWISYQDFAIALVDELETPARSRQRFTVGY